MLEVVSKQKIQKGTTNKVFAVGRLIPLVFWNEPRLCAEQAVNEGSFGRESVGW